MVGDSRTDIDTAKAAGIPVVAVDFGYTDLPVSTFEPSRIISHYDELTVAMAVDLIDKARSPARA
jgi:phosphoglycolate phosphatase